MKSFVGSKVYTKDIKKNNWAQFNSGEIFYANTFFTFKRSTHFAQYLLENYLGKKQEFLSYNIKLINKNSYKL